jgi:uncharacterized membrane protein YfcA
MFGIETIVITALVLGAFGGFVNSILKWLETQDAFSGKKNVKAIIVGIIAGIGLGVAAIQTIQNDVPFQVLVVQLVMIFLSAIAIDTITSRVSGMVSNRAAEESVIKQAQIKAREEERK